MAYEVRDADLDERIAQLVADAADGDNEDLIAEMIATVIKLHRDNASRGDLKLINTALKEHVERWREPLEETLRRVIREELRTA